MIAIGIDPSMSNTALVVIDTVTQKVLDSLLIETEPTKSKQVRVASDSVSRAKLLYDKTTGFLKEWPNAIIFVETPSGSQGAAAAKSYGMVSMLIATISPDPIQVTPDEVKIAAVGRKTASKKEMMDWASTKHPEANWDRNKDGSLKNKNEHLADAIAVVYAGMETPDFKRLMALS